MVQAVASRPSTLAALRTVAPAGRPAGLWVVIGVLALFGAELAATLAASDGHFTYSLDDPYIHLALSEQVRLGHYGFNAGEASTPSSSVAWPVLLALTAGTGLHVWTPLLVNLGATLLSGHLILRAVRAAFPALSERAAAGAALLVVVCLNLIGVAFTGLEHSAHIVTSLAIGLGLLERSRGRALPWWAFLAIMVGPWLRYEGLAVSLAAALVLVGWGERLKVAAAMGVAVAPLVAFSTWAVAAGLDPLPSSVEFKSGVVRGGSRLTELAAAWHFALTQHLLFVLALLTILAHVALRRRVDGLDGFALMVLIAHASVGQFGWLWRYELYAYAAVAPIILVRIADFLSCARWPWPRVSAALALVIFVSSSIQYALALVDSPRATRNVWLQQAQMARFAADWSGPVAVNDIGLVRYVSHDYVLDLWGLANQEARRSYLAEDYSYMERLSAQHHVRLVMLYDSSFPEIPDKWVQVAQLTFEGPRVSAGDRVVSFYATTADDVAEIRQRLEMFGESLPQGAHLAMTPRNSAI